MGKGTNLIAVRYARSLFSDENNGKELGKQGRYQQAFEALHGLFEIREAVDVIKSPAMPIDLKKNLLGLALDQSNADEMFRNFISYLLDAKREALIPQIAAAYEDIVADLRNEKRATIVSARALAADSLLKIEESLENVFGKKVLLSTELNSGLLGGFVVEAGNFLFDCSLRTMVDKAMK